MIKTKWAFVCCVVEKLLFDLIDHKQFLRAILPRGACDPFKLLALFGSWILFFFLRDCDLGRTEL